MSTDPREMVLTHHYRAPRDLVFEAFTTPAHLDRWWGPDGFTTETHAHDLRPGGDWLFTMRHPEHGSFPNRMRYLEVVPSERLVADHDDGEGGRIEAFRQTITFADDGQGGTVVELRVRFPSAEAWARAQEMGASEGGRQTLAHLDAILAEEAEGDLVLERRLDAPRERVWAAWTEPARLGAWWGPKGFNISVHRFELRPGGLFHYGMEAPGDNPMGTSFGRMVYREVVAPERLVWINSFSDAAGGIGRHPLAPGFPAEILNVLTLRSEGGRTHLQLRGRPIRASAEERAFYQQMRGSMEAGFGGTFQQLEVYLAG